MKDIAFQILANENNSTKIAKSIEAVGSWLTKVVNTVFEKHIVLESLDTKFLSGNLRFHVNYYVHLPL